MSNASGSDGPVLTTRQGHPVHDNQDQRTVGPRGPATLENYQFLEKISHFDRERVPERVVHARGFVAHGHFEAYGTIGDEPASRYTRAKLFQSKGIRTPVTARLSTVIGGRDSSESARDPRGFAVKFRTDDGNWDLVGNNLPVFFIRDAIKFPDVVHAFKPDPVTFRQDANRIFDFCTLQPSSLHLLTMVMTTRGIPRSWRTMHGFGVNTYRMVNATGEGVLVKYHWLSQQGVEGMTADEAARQQGQDLGHASKDVRDAIEQGDYPRWELCVQVMSDDEHPELDFDPLDATKTWPHGQLPLRPVGMMTLDTNVKNHFLENEQVAFGTGVLVDGLDFSDDKLLVGRTFSYSDTQRHRIGPNYLQLPVNRPVVPVHTNQRDGSMAYGSDGEAFNPHVNYEPSQRGGVREADQSYKEYRPDVSGQLTKAPIERRDDWKQPGELYRKLSERDRDDLIHNLTAELAGCDKMIQERAVAHFARCDRSYGEQVAAGIGIDLDSLDVEGLTSQH
ncbi:MAG: catalase [Acidimicrobiales bacterium]